MTPQNPVLLEAFSKENQPSKNQLLHLPYALDKEQGQQGPHVSPPLDEP